MKKLFWEIHQGRDIRGLFAKEYKATDSSFYAKYESGDWIPYDEKRDNIDQEDVMRYYHYLPMNIY